MAITLVLSAALLAFDRLGPGLELERWAHAFTERLAFRDVVLDGMLAFPLFAGSLHVDLGRLLGQRQAVGVLATVGVLVTTLATGDAPRRPARPRGRARARARARARRAADARRGRGGRGRPGRPATRSRPRGWLVHALLQSVDDDQVEVLLTLALAASLSRSADSCTPPGRWPWSWPAS